MDIKLEKILVDKYPKLFEEYGKSPKESCMAFGCDCGDGWFGLLDELCLKLSKYNVILVQVKEKWGGLRVYVHGGSEEVWDLLDRYEEKSYSVCEQCGKEGKTREGSYVVTLCDNCYKERYKA